MQFNYSNSANYLAGGAQVSNTLIDTYDTSQKTGTNVNKLVQAQSKKRYQQMGNAINQVETVGDKAVDIQTGKKLTDMDAKLKKDIRNINRPAKMAGALAATVDTGNAYLMYDKERKLKLKEDAEYKAAGQTQMDLMKKSFEAKIDAMKKSEDLAALKIEKLKTELNNPGTQVLKPDTPGTPQTGSSKTSAQSISTVKPFSYTGSLDSLSPEDKKWIAYGVSGEAHPNSPDELAVAGVIMNRMKQTGKSAYDVIHAPGQFAAVTGIGHAPTAKHVPGLQEKLFNTEGLANLESTMQLLNGRTQFRGQTLLHNRGRSGNPDLDGDGRPDLDLMVHPKGNFYFRDDQA